MESIKRKALAAVVFSSALIMGACSGGAGACVSDEFAAVAKILKDRAGVSGGNAGHESDETTATVFPEKRLALIIGNGAYEDAPLKLAATDAKALAARVRTLGFDVMLHLDVDRQAMTQVLGEFHQQLSEQKGVGLFYYAGHAMQRDGKNYLVPLGADLAAFSDMTEKGVSVDTLVDDMHRANNAFNWVVLDAARSYPIPSEPHLNQPGLARMDVPIGTVITFAASPGEVVEEGNGEQGVFATSLLAHIGKPALEFDHMMNSIRGDVFEATNGGQTPYAISSKVGKFYFHPTEPGLSNGVPLSRLQQLVGADDSTSRDSDLTEAGLIDRARKAVNKYQLRTPRDESALEYAEQVLRMNPNHADATQLVHDITDTYLSWSASYLRKGLYRQAERNLEKAYRTMRETGLATEMQQTAMDRLWKKAKIGQDESHPLHAQVKAEEEPRASEGKDRFWNFPGPCDGGSMRNLKRVLSNLEFDEEKVQGSP